MMPGVVYGRHLDSTAISFNQADFNRLFEEVGEATIFTLTIDGETHDVLVHDFQRDPVSYQISHVDFYAVEKGQKITVSVPLEFIGEAPVEDNEGQIVKVHHELEVECEPRNLPSHIDVDLTGLTEIGDSIFIKDLKLGEGVESILDAEEVVVTTSEVKTVEEADEEANEEMDLSSIEVEGQDNTENVADEE